MVPHFWLKEKLIIVAVADNFCWLLGQSMDDLKLYGKTKCELQSLAHAVQIILKGIGMELEWTNTVLCL